MPRRRPGPGAVPGAGLAPVRERRRPGVEIGGALKNVIAIAAGAVEGLGLGHNAMAALITRGLVEISRLACAEGGRRDTLAGLSGLGDLVLTCTGDLSRNRRVGIELGRGRTLDEVLSGLHMVAEGVRTTGAALELGAKHGIELPITARWRLSRGQVPRDAVEPMGRPQRAEIEAGRFGDWDWDRDSGSGSKPAGAELGTNSERRWQPH